MTFTIIDSEDGSIQGWVVSLFITLSVFTFLLIGLLNENICNRLVKIGSLIGTVYVSQFAAWLAYRSVKLIKTGTT